MLRIGSWWTADGGGSRLEAALAARAIETGTAGGGAELARGEPGMNERVVCFVTGAIILGASAIGTLVARCTPGRASAGPPPPPTDLRCVGGLSLAERRTAACLTGESGSMSISASSTCMLSAGDGPVRLADLSVEPAPGAAFLGESQSISSSLLLSCRSSGPAWTGRNTAASRSTMSSSTRSSSTSIRTGDFGRSRLAGRSLCGTGERSRPDKLLMRKMAVSVVLAGLAMNPDEVALRGLVRSNGRGAVVGPVVVSEAGAMIRLFWGEAAESDVSPSEATSKLRFPVRDTASVAIGAAGGAGSPLAAETMPRLGSGAVAGWVRCSANLAPTTAGPVLMTPIPGMPDAFEEGCESARIAREAVAVAPAVVMKGAVIGRARAVVVVAAAALAALNAAALLPVRIRRRVAVLGPFPLRARIEFVARDDVRSGAVALSAPVPAPPRPAPAPGPPTLPAGVSANALPSAGLPTGVPANPVGQAFSSPSAVLGREPVLPLCRAEVRRAGAGRGLGTDDDVEASGPSADAVGWKVDPEEVG